jgi:hypothetical protein
MIDPGDKVGSWPASCRGRGISRAKCADRATMAGDGADGKMDRRTSADGNGRICESLVISTSEGGQTHHMTISRTDPFMKVKL